jgi:hypothetical protein
VLGVAGLAQQPRDLAADGQQLVQVLGHDRQPDGVGAQLGVDGAAKPMSTRTVPREVATSTSFASR